MAERGPLLERACAFCGTNARRFPVKALEKGAYIKHFQYGLGVVSESNSQYTNIDFDVHGAKKFLTAVMVVEQAEGTPPKRKRRPKKVLAAAAGAR
jgi:hypothetical protein